MPNRSKQKGDRTERQIVELLRSYGLDAYRIPLSGAVNGFKSDIEIRKNGETLKLESKCRAAGFSRIYKWLGDNDALILKADRADPLVVLNIRRFARLLAGIPLETIMKTMDKASHNQPLDNPSLNIEPVNDYEGLYDSGPVDTAVRVNQPVIHPLRLPSEEDLRKRDEELLASRRFT